MLSKDAGTQRTEAHIEDRRPSALVLYLGFIASLWFLTLLPLLLRTQRLWNTRVLWDFPLAYFDFTCYSDRIKLLHTSAFWTASAQVAGDHWDYPAPCVFFYQFFYLFDDGINHRFSHPLLVYFAGAALLVAAGIGLLTRALVRRGVGRVFALMFSFLSLATCWPIGFCLERGNMQFYLDAGIGAGLWAYTRRRYWLAAVLIGLFGSCKLYPLLFLGLLIPLQRWKEIALGLATAAGMTVFAGHWLGPVPVEMQKSLGVANGLKIWLVTNSLHMDWHVLGFDHSIFAALKQLCYRHPGRLGAVAIAYAVVGGVAGLVLFFGPVWKMPRPNHLLLISAAALLLPPTSFDYTLSLLIPAWAWIVVLTVSSRDPRYDLWGKRILVLFALLFAPEAFFVFHGNFHAGQLKLFCLLGLVAISATIPLTEPANPVLLHEA